jgi:hypothetical protein
MVRYKVKDAVDETEQTSTEPKCAHYWIIEPATGATSMGMCKLCGAEKEFSNQFKRSSLISPDFSSVGATPAKDEDVAETPVESATLP